MPLMWKLVLYVYLVNWIVVHVCILVALCQKIGFNMDLYIIAGKCMEGYNEWMWQIFHDKGDTCELNPESIAFSY